MTTRSLLDLTPAEFENLTYDLVTRLGLKNSVWRTPGRDGGRDIQGNAFVSDLSGHVTGTSWYIECKRYAGTVDWPTVWEKIAYADSNNADVLLVVTSSSLSPQAVDEVNRWNDRDKKPHVRFWNGSDVEARLDLYPDIRTKYGLSKAPVQDAALSVLDLSRVLLKYSNSITACAIFAKSIQRRLDVIQTVSELITARVSEIETHGRIFISPFKESIDAEPWIVGSLAVQSLKFDRYAFRAIAAILYCHTSSDNILVEKRAESLSLVCKEIPISLLSDLFVLGFWGSIKISLERDSVILESTYATD